jgi:hypothetical protein
LRASLITLELVKVKKGLTCSNIMVLSSKESDVPINRGVGVGTNDSSRNKGDHLARGIEDDLERGREGLSIVIHIRMVWNVIIQERAKSGQEE